MNLPQSPRRPSRSGRLARLALLTGGLTQAVLAQTFTHPGLLHTQADFDRMTAKVAANAQPWKSGWDRLVANSHAQLAWTPQPTTYLIRGASALGSENYSKAMNDSAAAYQTALRWKLTGDTAYADKSVQILNAWAATCVSIEGDSNQSLAAGIYGYQFANAAEIMRAYAGWAPADFADFQQWMLTVFYAKNHDFLVRHHDTCDSHYWANWDLCNLASMMAIGVLCDDQAVFDEAVAYFQNGVGNGKLDLLVHHLHPGHLGQIQESGRDQGHATLCLSLVGVLCEQAWNQGVDFYGLDNNRILAGAEYVAKYNLLHDVPFTIYRNCDGIVHTAVSADGRGTLRTGWESIHHHYVNRLGLAAPFTGDMAELLRPEGGGGDYGPNSGGFDHLGFGALVSTLDPVAAGAAPSGLRADVAGRQVTLSWWGSAHATGYQVKRALAAAGPYSTVATVVGDRAGNYLLDPGLSSGTTYHYVVTADLPTGESAASAPVAALADQRLPGAVIGTPGSFNNLGSTIACVFDDELQNFYDAASASGQWAGLDLGAGVSAVVNQVAYCPRAGFPSRMVGGKFQGSDTADFSSGVTDLFTITTAPAEGVLTTQTVSNPAAFRYLRYLGPNNGFCNVAEVRFHGAISGLATPAAPVGLSATPAVGQVDLVWTASPGATAYQVKRATTTGGPYVIVGQPDGPTFRDSFGIVDGVTYYYVVTALNSAGVSGISGQTAATAPYGVVKLTGAIIGSIGSWGNNPATTKEAALDGNTATFYDAAATSGAWVGLDLGASGATALTDLSYFPRTNYSARMTGGVFQGSNTADFSSGVVNLHTIAAQPAEGLYASAAVTDPTSFRYVRYLGPTGGGCNVAEVEFYRAAGTLTAPAAPTGLSATVASASQINLSWTASTGAHTYTVKRSTTGGAPYTTLATDLPGLAYNDPGLAAGATYTYVVSAVNPIGASPESASASATTPGLPAPWTTLDIGAVAAAGSANHAAGTFTVLGSGADIWGSADEFRYVQQASAGDCDLIVRVAGVQNTNSQAKAGIMIRESAAAGARYAGVFVTPGAGVRFQRRSTTGGSTSNTSVSGLAAPRWLRLTRTGNVFRAYHSANGSTWTQIGSNATISMASAATLGLAVSSRADGTLCTATVDNVTATP